jgi:hypothetical protein
LRVTLQVLPEIVSQPLQPAKVDPSKGVALRFTTVPLLKRETQVGSHKNLGPVTFPLPVPLMCMLSVVRVDALKLTVTVLSVLSVSVQTLPETVSQPVHPDKNEPSAGVAVSEIVVPWR